MTVMDRISRILERLSVGGVVECSDWPGESDILYEGLGLVCTDGFLEWPHQLDSLDNSFIQAELAMLKVATFSITDSTNTRLVQLGAKSSVASRLYLAEFQHGGRGRRGRPWLSPYARNLAMSLGVETKHKIAELGGLSLVVGLGLASGFESLGINSLRLKWPNDILICELNTPPKKLSGILVELLQRGDCLEYVVGMGVNVTLSDAEIDSIGQPATDLQRCGVSISRTDLVVTLISSVLQYLELFEVEGFSPFVNAFNENHLFHEETCSIVQGENAIVGRVLGVGGQGELILDTNNGVQSFHGGEVSLRA